MLAPTRLLLALRAAAFVALALAAGRTGAQEPGFGGAAPDVPDVPDVPGEPGGDPLGSLGEDVCVIQGDDGVWRACSEVLAEKSAGATDLVPEDPETRALRERMKAADEAARAPPPPPRKTKLEVELEKGRLDPTMPLLAVRVDVARAEQRIEELEARGQGGREKAEAEAALARAKLILDDVERIALHRMDICAQRRGNKPLFKGYRMTAGGAVLATVPEMLAQLPVIDPAGCERILLVDREAVERVKRVHELRRVLKTRTFGYHQVAERKALEKELKDLEAVLARDAVAALAAPGVRDPY